MIYLSSKQSLSFLLSSLPLSLRLPMPVHIPFPTHFREEGAEVLAVLNGFQISKSGGNSAVIQASWCPQKNLQMENQSQVLLWLLKLMLCSDPSFCIHTTHTHTQRLTYQLGSRLKSQALNSFRHSSPCRQYSTQSSIKLFSEPYFPSSSTFHDSPVPSVSYLSSLIRSKSILLPKLRSQRNPPWSTEAHRWSPKSWSSPWPWGSHQYPHWEGCGAAPEWLHLWSHVPGGRPCGSAAHWGWGSTESPCARRSAGSALPQAHWAPRWW